MRVYGPVGLNLIFYIVILTLFCGNFGKLLMSLKQSKQIQQDDSEQRIKGQMLKKVAISKLILSVTMGFLVGYFGLRGSNGLALYLAMSSTLGITIMGQSAVNQGQGKVSSGELFLEALAPAICLYLLVWMGVLNYLHPLKA